MPAAEVVFRGHGWGHGVGMSQYGAEGAARLGCTASQILGTYYPGTQVATRDDRPSVGVRMVVGTRRASVGLQQGGITWRNGRRKIAVQRGGAFVVRRRSSTTAELRHKGRVVWSGTVRPNGLRAVIGRSIVRLNSPRDTYGKLPMRLKHDEIRFTVGPGGMDVTKWFFDNGRGRAMDKYLFGLAEVPVSWPTQALRAQVIAARTFAYRRNGLLRPTPDDQNYGGYATEESDARSGGRWREAVLATSGRIVVDSSGHAISALYSSSMAGWTEDAAYSFGGSASYLRPVNDATWERASSNPASRRAWTRGFTRQQVADALGFRTITQLSVAPRGSAARAQGMRIVGVKRGSTTPVTEWVRGFTVRTKLALLSPGFTIAFTPPPPPP
jgi:hypothetical protein